MHIPAVGIYSNTRTDDIAARSAVDGQKKCVFSHFSHSMRTRLSVLYRTSCKCTQEEKHLHVGQLDRPVPSLRQTDLAFYRPTGIHPKYKIIGIGHNACSSTPNKRVMKSWNPWVKQDNLKSDGEVHAEMEET